MPDERCPPDGTASHRHTRLISVRGTVDEAVLAQAFRTAARRYGVDPTGDRLTLSSHAAPHAGLLDVGLSLARRERRAPDADPAPNVRLISLESGPGDRVLVVSAPARRTDPAALDDVCWHAFDIFEGRAARQEGDADRYHEVTHPDGPREAGSRATPDLCGIPVATPGAEGWRAAEAALAAFGIVMARYTGEEDTQIAVLTPAAGQPHRPVVRPFSAAPASTTTAALARAEAALRSAPAIGAPRRTTDPAPYFFDACGTWTRTLPAGVTVRMIERHDGAFRIGLRWQAGSAGERIELLVADPTVSAIGVARLAESLQLAVSELLGGAADVTAVSPRQRAWLRQVGSGGGTFPSTTVDRLVWRRAARAPDARAVGNVTYGELIQLATVQADLLRAAGVGVGDRVLVSVPRSLAEIVALLGILRTGGCYVAVDPSLPDNQLAAIVELCAPRAAVADASVAARLASHGVTAVASMRPNWYDAVPAEFVPPPPDELRTAYVAFTSGSTGSPKGVAVPHRAVVRLALDPEFARCGPGQVMLRFAPLSFDASTLEIWAPLASGGAVAVLPPGVPSPGEFADALRDGGVTVAWLTAGLFESYAHVQPGAFRGLRQLLTGGDVVSAAAVRAVLHACPGLRITNGYGPTENTTFTTVHHVDSVEAVTEPLPIGRPIAGTAVLVLDGHGALVPPGAVGELYATGNGLALGYLADIEDGGDAFVHLSCAGGERAYRTGDYVRYDDEGRLCFLGRKDDQVKIRGHRIDLAEIRARVERHPEVISAAVFVEGDSSANRRLAVAVRPRSLGTLAAVRAEVSRALSPHQVPSVWHEVSEIPVTATGKVDYARLTGLRARRAPDDHEPGRVDAGAEDTPSADQIAAALFAEALGRDDVDADDDFFMLGGDSLAAVRMIGELHRRHGLQVPMRDFFQQPTQRRLAALISPAKATRA